MMKKIGFTLSEVLITLGIIGVVAALTAPALVNNTSNAQVGPKLAKAVSTIENANRKILMDAAVTDLKQVGTSTDDYMEKLSEQISGSSYETTAMNNSNFSPTPSNYNSNDFGLGLNSFRQFNFPNNMNLMLFRFSDRTLNVYGSRGAYKGGFANMAIDINGFQNAPNVMGKDIFNFMIDRNGSVIPVGSTAYAWVQNDDNLKYDVSSGDTACNENTVTTGKGCAGSIFDNNLKVIYR